MKQHQTIKTFSDSESIVMARSVAKVNWSKLADLVAPEQKAVFSAFRVKSETIAAKVESLPEKQRQIDWESYKTKLHPGKKALVDEMKKTMEGVKVSRPANTVTAEIDALKKEYVAACEETKTTGKARADALREKASRYTTLPCLTKMTLDEIYEVFPEVSPAAYEEEMASKGGHDDHHGDDDEEFDIQIPKFNELFPKKK